MDTRITLTGTKGFTDEFIGVHKQNRLWANPVQWALRNLGFTMVQFKGDYLLNNPRGKPTSALRRIIQATHVWVPRQPEGLISITTKTVSWKIRSLVVHQFTCSSSDNLNDKTNQGLQQWISGHILNWLVKSLTRAPTSSYLAPNPALSIANTLRTTKLRVYQIFVRTLALQSEPQNWLP